jgi:hypothetical protein
MISASAVDEYESRNKGDSIDTTGARGLRGAGALALAADATILSLALFIAD